MNAGRETSAARAALACIALTLSAVAVPAPVLGQPARFSITTEIDPCVPIDHARFQQQLEVDLGAMPHDEAPDDSFDSVRVTLTCIDDVVQLALDDSLTRKSIRRWVDLDPVDPSERTRLMALTAVELVMASWLELRLLETERLEPVGPKPPATVVAQASELVEPRLDAASRTLRTQPRLDTASRTLQLGAALEALAFSSVFQPIPSVALRLTVPVASRFVLRIGAQLGYASLEGYLDERQLRPAPVRMTSTSLLLALSYAARAGSFELAAGLGGRLGFARLAGVARSDASLEHASSFAPWAGPLATVSASYRVADELDVSVGLEAGFVALRAKALAPNEVVVTELRDLWGGVSLGLDWSLR